MFSKLQDQVAIDIEREVEEGENRKREGARDWDKDEFIDLYLNYEGDKKMSEQDREFQLGKSLDLLATQGCLLV